VNKTLHNVIYRERRKFDRYGSLLCRGSLVRTTGSYILGYTKRKLVLRFPPGCEIYVNIPKVYINTDLFAEWLKGILCQKESLENTPLISIHTLAQQIYINFQKTTIINIDFTQSHYNASRTIERSIFDTLRTFWKKMLITGSSPIQIEKRQGCNLDLW
jgi:hypothetical protein